MREQPPPRPIASSTALPSQQTLVEIIWVEKKIEHWLRFGHVAEDRVVSRSTRIKTFRPGEIFALVRWAPNDFGTVHSRIDIVRAVAPGEAYTTLPFVRPGGELLLKIESWGKVAQALRAVDAVEAAGVDPCDAAPDHWRHVHNRITAGRRPRDYTHERHRAWRLRREIQS